MPLLADEFAWLLSLSGWSVVWGAFSWLAYISFVPPAVVAAHARVVDAAGRGSHARSARRSRSARGIARGLLHTVIVLVQFEVSGRSTTSPFLRVALDTLQSSAWFASIVLFVVLNGVQSILAGIAALVLLRLIVRRTWIATAILVASVVPLYAVSGSPTGALVAAALVLIGVALMLRAGVLATVTMAVVADATKYVPLTLDTQAWYFGQSLVVLLLISGLAIYGFFVALAGRPAFGSIPSR